jgi:hypothetical protein
MDKIIVLEISGKGDIVDFVRVRLYDNEEDIWGLEINDEEKYWTYKAIVNEGEEYEIGRNLITK